ncbi:MAG: hypothetical protein ACTHP8_07735 [Bosea sp. (in: a-proteobacteria)]|uniref:hypothetical protein n=1 Tax=Bosea sp. (in: a-proteobacteria) TaxID=1871050 RepID=UPI003F7C4D18
MTENGIEARSLVQETRLQVFTAGRQVLILRNQVRCYLAKKAATPMQAKRASCGRWAAFEKQTLARPEGHLSSLDMSQLQFCNDHSRQWTFSMTRPAVDQPV